MSADENDLILRALSGAQAALNPLSRMVRHFREGGPEDRHLERVREEIRVAIAARREEMKP